MAWTDKFRRSSGTTFAGKISELSFEASEFKNDAGKKYSKITAKLFIEKDGADKPLEQYLDAGFFYPDTMEIDGATVTVEEGKAGLSSDTPFFKFLETAVENGFPEDEIDGSDFTSLTTYRFEFGYEIDTARQMAAGKKKLGPKAKGATDEEIMAAGKRQDKKDKSKSYNHQNLVVRGVLGPVEETKSGKKTAGKPVAAKSAGKKGKPADDGVSDDRADEVLAEIIAGTKDGSLNRKKISSEVVKYQLANDLDPEERDALREKLFDGNYLVEAAERGVVNYDDDSEMITVVKKRKAA